VAVSPAVLWVVFERDMSYVASVRCCKPCRKRPQYHVSLYADMMYHLLSDTTRTSHIVPS
jgi:hypothetical protein